MQQSGEMGLSPGCFSPCSVPEPPGDPDTPSQPPILAFAASSPSFQTLKQVPTGTIPACVSLGNSFSLTYPPPSHSLGAHHPWSTAGSQGPGSQECHRSLWGQGHRAEHQPRCHSHSPLGSPWWDHCRDGGHREELQPLCISLVSFLVTYCG